MDLEKLQEEARKELNKYSREIPYSIVDDYRGIDELYDEYLYGVTSSGRYLFYYFNKRKQIVCLHTMAVGSDRYFVEVFPIEEYKDAIKWFKNEA